MSLIENERTNLVAAALNNFGRGDDRDRGYRPHRRRALWLWKFGPKPILVPDRRALVSDRNRPTLFGTVGTREAPGMTEVQIYAVVAPLVLLLVAAIGTYWWLHRPYPENSSPKSH
jgi:hypothetical protein